MRWSCMGNLVMYNRVKLSEVISNCSWKVRMMW